MSKIISVYINGTFDENKVPEKGSVSLASLLEHLTVNDGPNSFSICINGCGVESRDIRDMRVVFGFHLKKQVAKIAERIEELANESEDNIVLNLYGFSRGGIAAFLLCQKLKHIALERLTINVASFDPVPLNYITSVCTDMFFGTKNTLSGQVADLTQCANLDNLIILFTNYPLPDIMGFAPILPALPATCTAEVDVTPGSHETAVSFYKDGESVKAQNNESVIGFHRIVEFMQKCGTRFDFGRLQLNNNLVYPCAREQLLDLYGQLVREAVSQKPRLMHLYNSIHTTEGRPYLNRHHQKLSGADIRPDECILSIKNHPHQVNLRREQVVETHAESSNQSYSAR